MPEKALLNHKPCVVKLNEDEDEEGADMGEEAGTGEDFGFGCNGLGNAGNLAAAAALPRCAPEAKRKEK